MKLTKTAKTQLKPGMTLIEITVVILVLLTLIAVLFIGANIYKKGADRAACILNIRNVHQAVRAHQNLNGNAAEDDLDYDAEIYAVDFVAESAPGAGDGTAAKENFLVEPTCPTGPEATAVYTESLADKYPAANNAAVTCALYSVDLKHAPESTKGW